MLFDNNEKDKEQWRKNERRMRRIIIGIILAVLMLVIILIFFSTQIWAIITNVAIIIGLIVDLISIINMKEGR